MINPTPSPAPRGELSASFVLASIKTELLKRSQDYGAIGDFIPLLEDKVESLTKHAAAISEENERLKRDYHELLFAVARKHDNETRHQTALRYINEAEASANHVATAVSSRPAAHPAQGMEGRGFII